VRLHLGPRPAGALAGALLIAAAVGGCATPARTGLHGLPEKTFPPPQGVREYPQRSLADLEGAAVSLYPVLGAYPPRFTDARHREQVYAVWAELALDAGAIPRGEQPERRLFLLAEVYRLGHNLDVAGAAERADGYLDACLSRYPESSRCNRSAAWFYLSVIPTPARLAQAERSLTLLRAQSAPEPSENAEAGFVFLALARRDVPGARAQIDRYLQLFPDSARADDLRRMRDRLGDEIRPRTAP